jgi:hypothetical protein
LKPEVYRNIIKRTVHGSLKDNVSGSVATSNVVLAVQVEGQASHEEEYPFLQFGEMGFAVGPVTYQLNSHVIHRNGMSL